MTASDPYARLGLSRVVNAADTVTALGGGPLDPRVVEAMGAAATRYVDVAELLDRAGRELARTIGVESALVTNSAVSAVALAVAGAIAGGSPAAVDRAPWHATERREVVALRAQRNPYDRSVAIGGGVIVEAGYSDGTAPWQVEAAIGERTAALLWFAGTQFEHYALGIEDMRALATAHGLPLIVDAAAQVPPASNLWGYVRQGADAVAFSGGKGLRGPQDTALLVGASSLVDAARAHAFPHYGIGRAMKVSKEGVAGLLTATLLALDRDEPAEYAALLARCEAMAVRLRPHPACTVTVVPDGVLGQATPRVRLDLDPAGTLTAAGLAGVLLRREPAIFVRTELTAPHAVFLNPFPLEPADDDLVVAAVLAALDTAGGPER